MIFFLRYKYQLKMQDITTGTYSDLEGNLYHMNEMSYINQLSDFINNYEAGKIIIQKLMQKPAQRKIIKDKYLQAKEIMNEPAKPKEPMGGKESKIPLFRFNPSRPPTGYQSDSRLPPRRRRQMNK